jgi:hypothetical protein
MSALDILDAVKKKDYSDELKTLIPESISVAKLSGLDEAIVLLLGLEKKCRL